MQGMEKSLSYEVLKNDAILLNYLLCNTVIVFQKNIIIPTPYWLEMN